MKIAIIGAGNAGVATAADLSIKGHSVSLVKSSDSLHNENFNYLLQNNGKVVLNDMDGRKEGFIREVTYDFSVISDAEVVMVYVQTNYHEAIVERIIPHLRDKQIVLFNPGYFVTAYMLKHGAFERADITVVEAESSFIDCRISEPGQVKVGFRNVRNPLGIYPSANYDAAVEKLQQLGFPYVYYRDIVSAALHNPNMIVHTVGAVMSIPMIDREGKNFCMYHSAFTEHVWNILEQLDKEKMDILERMGHPRLPYVEACKFRNSLDDGEDAKQVFFNYAAMPTRAKAPDKVDSRYITEDVPQGLVMLESLGATLDIPTPVCSSLINLASASLNRDFRAVGRTLETLGVENIRKILADGK